MCKATWKDILIVSLAVAVVIAVAVAVTDWASRSAMGVTQEAAAATDVVGWLTGTPALTVDVRRSVLIDRIAANPGEVELIVAAIKSGSDQPTFEYVAADLVTLDATERALAACRTIPQAHAVVMARSTLRSRIERDLRAIAQRLSDEAKGHAGDPAKALRSKIWAAEVDRLQVLADQAELVESPAKPIISNVIADATGQAAKQLEHAKSFIKGVHATAHTARTPIEPTPTTMPMSQRVGDCEFELNAVRETLAWLDSERLRAWTMASGEAASETRLAEIEEQLSNAAAELTDLQLTLYNLWAIRQIYAAEDSGEWPAYLGAVDRSLLHPSVGAMWNLVHDRRFPEVQDRANRPAVVRRLLTAQPVKLEQF